VSGRAIRMTRKKSRGTKMQDAQGEKRGIGIATIPIAGDLHYYLVRQSVISPRIVRS